MSLHIYQISAYDHRAEAEQFEHICQLLSTLYVDQDCLCIGNFNIEGVELDALLITPYTIRVIEFKHWGGTVVAAENGAWTADGKVIDGGSGNKSPFFQMRINRSRTSLGLSRLLGRDLSHHVKGCVLFARNCQIYNELSPTVRLWMDVCDNQGMPELLRGDFSCPRLFTDEEMKAIAGALRIERFAKHPGKRARMQREEPFYTKSSDMSYFAQLEERCTEGALDQRLSALRDIFYRFVEEELHGCRLTFSGLFSKVDYLIKENKIPQQASYEIHETRKRLFSRREEQTEALTTEDLNYDLKVVSTFISLIRQNASIPYSLSRHFAYTPRKLSWGKFDENCLRVIVNEWDENYIYVTEEQSGRDIQVCYGPMNTYLTRDGKGDWQYLRDILHPDAQLNLVRLRYNEGLCLPELIIFEPDYLINITSVASCFEDNLRQTPFLGLINKVMPSESSKHIHLGNLSGAMLDETVHKRNSPFEASYDNFFHDHIMGIICNTKDTDTEEFLRENGQEQRRNIEKLMGEDITQSIQDYNRNRVLLEPSFFSPTLGIQGRLDYLYEDGGNITIVEQKSGKSQFVSFRDPNYDPNRIEPIKKHVVQLLLYRALFAYEHQKRADQLQHMLLLYSKYSNGLVSIGQRPELMLEAIKMRNLLAWCEIRYASPGGFKLMESITPSYLKGEQAAEQFFQRYKEPQYRAVLDPLAKASAVEKAYYFRFQQFLAREQLLSRMGNRIKEASGFSSIWLDTLETKKQTGSIFDELRIHSFGLKDEAVSTVTLAFSEKQSSDTTKFRIGDLAFLYHYEVDKEPNACAQMVHRGAILDITDATVTLRLTNDQTDRKVFEKDTEKFRWAIEPDMIDSGSASLYQNMHGLLTANQERRDLLLKQREPQVDATRQPRLDHGPFSSLVLHAKQASDYFLVIGPPGTGKTSHAMLHLLQEELAEPDGRILLLSFTNRAVDEMCATLKEHGIGFMRIGNELSCAPEYKDNLIANQLRDCRTKMEGQQRFVSTRVICGTTSSLNAHLELLQLSPFSLAIVDESSQILEPHLVGLLSAKREGENAIGRIVLIGDHKQLPAVVQQDAEESEVKEAELTAIGLHDCRLSLFERLLNYHRNEVGEFDPQFVYMLTKQGRMHPDIAQFPNYAFYANKLENLGKELARHQGIIFDREAHTGNGIRDMLHTRAIAFVATPFVANAVSDKVNQVEANMIAATVYQIYCLEQEGFDASYTVGIIVPYRNQIATIRNAITRVARENGLAESAVEKLHRITIDTVERYQGSQRRYILYGFTIQRAYQLNFLSSTSFVEDGAIIDRKLNVAMTRAREHLIIFGNPVLLNENSTFYKMMEFIRSKNGYIDVTPQTYCSGHFEVGRRWTDECIPLNMDTDGVDEDFRKAFAVHILDPIRKDARTQLPDLILGNTGDVNLTQISYGRTAPTEQMNLFSSAEERNIALTPEDQALIYAYYLMPMYYGSACAIYLSCKDWFMSLAQAFGDRVHLYDIGCGPATCGLAALSAMPDFKDKWTYRGIDVAPAMRDLGERMLHEMGGEKDRMTFTSSFHDFDDAHWQCISEAPSLVIFHLSHLFASVSSQFAEDLANRIKEIAERFPLNRYVLVIQNAEHDAKGNTFRTFHKCLGQKTKVLMQEYACFPHQLIPDSKTHVLVMELE